MLALGLMSGTSADGITAAFCRFSNRAVRVTACRTFPYSPQLRRRILQAPSLRAAELSRLNFEIGEAFAQAALKMLRHGKPRVIGSHGQTVWHGPDQRPANTMQLGEPCLIAERTGIDVAADFRPRDMAAGGQGAPLIPAFDEFLFGSGPLRAVQNIGGIANVSFVGRGKLWSAFDTGPGNALMDLAVRLATRNRRAMDAEGRWALRGKPDEEKVRRLLALPYFKAPPPKSLDKDFFGASFLSRHFGAISTARLPHVLATLAEFTAASIADAYRRFAPGPLSEAVISGGGALNPVLRHRLARRLKPVAVVRSDSYGLPVMSKEAAGFAWMALRAVSGLPNNCPRATGAPRPAILGKIIPGTRRHAH